MIFRVLLVSRHMICRCFLIIGLKLLHNVLNMAWLQRRAIISSITKYITDGLLKAFYCEKFDLLFLTVLFFPFPVTINFDLLLFKTPYCIADAGTHVDSYVAGKIKQLKEQIATLEKREERWMVNALNISIVIPLL